MKNVLWVCTVFLTLNFCDEPPKKNEKKMKETSTKMQSDWEVLFDGSSTDQWHTYNGEGMSENWHIEDDALVFRPQKGKPKQNIVTNKEYTNFELSLEWRISEVGNSGIFYGVVESENYFEPYLTGPEIQVLDNERHPDAKIKPNYHQAGALYDMVQPSTDVCKPAGEWNHILLTVDHKNNKASVVLNGTEIVSYEPNGANWDAMVTTSKFGNKKAPDYIEAPDFGKFQTGKIGLQDHDDVVSYRNIKIREIQ